MRVASVLPRPVGSVGLSRGASFQSTAFEALVGVDRFSPRFSARGEDKDKERSVWMHLLTGVLGISSLVHAAQFAKNYNDGPSPVNSRQQMEQMKQEVLSQVDNRIGWEHIVGAVNEATPSTAFISGVGGSGSGVLVRSDDGRLFVMTNAHVLEDKNEILPEGAEYQVRLYNGSDTKIAFTFNAKVLKLADGSNAFSSSKKNDLAILEVPKNIILPQGVKPVVFRDIAKNPLKVGEPVLAIGAPYGYSDSVTIGILSHLDRLYAIEPENKFFQHSAPIGPGNSGGGLFVLRMENGKPVVELVGINTLNIRNAEGFGGAIHPDIIQRLLKSWKIVG